MNIATEIQLFRGVTPVAGQDLNLELNRRPLSVHILNDEDAFLKTDGALEAPYITTELKPVEQWLWEDNTLVLKGSLEQDTVIIAVFNQFNDGRPYFCSECRTPAPVGCDHNPLY